ncbi:MAG: hypothetical protein HYW86_03845 [Candidatus Roizmanbacteria bacterium]|nr:MAG: hypothetical protein HYW86_03845 [Candidatus Roizmanbacteria bacterium]
MIKKELREDDYFISQELSLVAALIAWDFPLIDIDKTNPKKMSFIFYNSSKLQKAIQSYWNESVKVSPKKYFYALKDVKSRIYGC